MQAQRGHEQKGETKRPRRLGHTAGRTRLLRFLLCLFLVSPLVVSSGNIFHRCLYSRIPLFLASYFLRALFFARPFFSSSFCAFLFAAPVGPKRERPQKAAQKPRSAPSEQKFARCFQKSLLPPGGGCCRCAPRASPFVWARPRVFALCYGAWCRAGPGQAVQAPRAHTRTHWPQRAGHTAAPLSDALPSACRGGAGGAPERPERTLAGAVTFALMERTRALTPVVLLFATPPLERTVSRGGNSKRQSAKREP